MNARGFGPTGRGRWHQEQAHVPTASLPDTNELVQFSPGQRRRGRSRTRGESQPQMPSELQPSIRPIPQWLLAVHMEKLRRGQRPAQESNSGSSHDPSVAQSCRRPLPSPVQPTIASRNHSMPAGGPHIRILAREGTVSCGNSTQLRNLAVSDSNILSRIVTFSNSSRRPRPSTSPCFCRSFLLPEHDSPQPQKQDPWGEPQRRSARAYSRVSQASLPPRPARPTHARAALACRDTAGEPGAPRTSHPSTRRRYHRAPFPSHLRRAPPPPPRPTLPPKTAWIVISSHIPSISIGTSTPKE